MKQNLDVLVEDETHKEEEICKLGGSVQEAIIQDSDQRLIDEKVRESISFQPAAFRLGAFNLLSLSNASTWLALIARKCS